MIRKDNKLIGKKCYYIVDKGVARSFQVLMLYATAYILTMLYLKILNKK